jgi:cytochrome P450
VPNAISSDGLSHKRFRTPYINAYSSARTATYESHIRETAHRLLDEIYLVRKMDVISQFAYPLTLDTILYTMGIPQERMEDAKRWSRDLIAFLYSPLSGERQAECARSLVAFQHYIAGLIQERRQERRDDAISEMVHSQLPGAEPLSMNELVSALCGLVMAGHKTSIDLIGNGLAILLNSASHWQKLCEQPELIPTTIEEILRYDSPVQALSRTATCDTTIGDISVPAGARILVVFGAANRDEMQFAVADSFEIQREPNRHLGFGYGIHFCVGAPLARLEGRIAFEVLTQKLPQLCLSPNQQLAHNPILAFRGYQRLEVEW